MVEVENSMVYMVGARVVVCVSSPAEYPGYVTDQQKCNWNS